MPEPGGLSWRGRLTDDYAVNLPIVEDDGHKLLNCWLCRYGSKVICIWQHYPQGSPSVGRDRIRRALASTANMLREQCLGRIRGECSTRGR